MQVSKSTMTVLAIAGGVLLTGLVNVALGQFETTIVPLDPRATYLHTNNDLALDTVPIALSTVGIQAGDVIRLERLGDWDCGAPCGDDITGTIGVFSASDVVLLPSLLNRVQDAIDAGKDFETLPTFIGGEATDIPEDFAITGTGVVISVPQGATHLFIAAHDNAYEDNTDPDGDYAVRISAVSCTPPPAGLVSWWPGDGDALDIVDGNSGTLQNGATFAPGKVGQAFSFDAVNAFVEVPDPGLSSNLDLSSFTLSAWINVATAKPLDRPAGVGFQTVVAKTTDVAPASFLRNYGLHVTPTNDPMTNPGTIIASFTEGINTWFVAHGISSVADGQWHHVAGTYDGVSLRVFIDSLDETSAELTGTFPIGGGVPDVFDGPVSIGLDVPNAPIWRMDGLVDEVQVFNRALSAEEIRAIFNAGSAGVCRDCEAGLLTNGGFETGDLSVWTASGENDGCAFIVEEGTCFSANDTTGITLNGSFVVNVRSSCTPPNTIDSVGILTSDPFVAGTGIAFRALSENQDDIPLPNPVTFEVQLLDPSDVVLLSQVVQTNIITLRRVDCPGEPRDGTFSAHFLDTTAFQGQLVKLRFRQHTNDDVFLAGFFTLVDDVRVLCPCLSSRSDARCVQGSVARAGVAQQGGLFPAAGLDDFATGAAFKVQMLDPTEPPFEITGLTDPNTIIGRSDPFLEGDALDVCAPIFNGGLIPYPDTAACAPDPCVFPTGFPENSLGGQEIHTEILSLNLTDGLGNFVKAGQPFFDSVVGTPQERFYQHSFGEVQGLDNDFPGDSFFNVFVEVTVGPMKFYNKTPMVLRAEITSFPPDLSLPRSVYLHDPTFPPTPLFDENGLHVAYLLSAGHGSVDVTPPPAACDPPTQLASPVSFTVDPLGTGAFPLPVPNHVKDDEGLDVQQVTVYQSSGQTPGAPPDITNARIDRLVGNVGSPAPPQFGTGSAINSSSFGRDGTRDATDMPTPGALLFSVDRQSKGDACSAVGLAADPTNPEQAADIYVAGATAFGAYAGPFLPTCPEFDSNCLLADQTALGLRPLIAGGGQDNLTGLEASTFAISDRFYGTFVGDSFDCGNEDCNTNGIPDGCEPDCNGNGIADECDITNGTSLDVNGNGFPDECEPCGPECTPPPRSLRGATIFLYDDQSDPVANPFQLGNLTVFAIAADLGLNEGDVIDALVLSDLTPGGGMATPNGVKDAGVDEVLFSLAPGSPTLLGPDGAPGVAGVDDDGVNGIDDDGETGLGDDRSPADILQSTFDGSFTVFTTSTALGLLVTDNVDALDIGPTLSIEDCNCNGVEDACDVAREFSNDCNTNIIPDECERAGNDCNCNDVPDECDIDPTDPDGNGQVSPNCNGNLIPDECELAECLPDEPSCQDCNANGVLDECDIVNCPPGDLTCQDCLPNGIPDGCEADCDGDGIPDDCEIASCPPEDVSCQDCNNNDIPDGCDIDPTDPDGNGQVSPDSNSNGVPDECEDCNQNGIPDDQEGTQTVAFVVQCPNPPGPCADGTRWSFLLDWEGPDVTGTCGGPELAGGRPPDLAAAFGQCIADAIDTVLGTSCPIVIDQPGNGAVFRVTVPGSGPLAICVGPEGGPTDCCVADANDRCPFNPDLVLCPPSGQDCNGNGTDDAIDICAAISPDCNGNAVPDGCDIASGTSFDCNINGVPDECECLALDAPTTPTGESGFAKNRYLSADAGNVGCKVAVRVTLTALPPPFDGLNGQTLWLGEPQEVCESAGQNIPPPAGCGPAPGLPSPTFQAATLQCTPHYTDWGSLGTVHVYHEGIVPESTYDIQAIGEGCDIAVEANYSLPLTIATSRWGDVVENCATIPCPPPDGITNILDVLAIVDKFLNASAAIIKARADLQPATPDGIVNILDVLFGVDALLGLDYPFPPGPAPCP